MPLAPPSSDLLARFRAVRARSCALRGTLSAEDCALQSMPDASPVKWHLAHTSWFFETFVVALARPDLRPFDDGYALLFNSYYESVGPRHARAERGMLSRPSLTEVEDYRAFVDARVFAILERDETEGAEEIRRRVEIGLQHEQQHQELLLTDVLHALSRSPLHPRYRALSAKPVSGGASGDEEPALSFAARDGGLARLGYEGTSFFFDNEGPAHRVFLEPYALSSRLLTNREMLAFIEEGGYREPSLWLAEGFDFVRREAIHAPLHWHRDEPGGPWSRFTPDGLVALELAAPVCHVSYYEADALARFVGGRLPTEAEWEDAARHVPIAGNFVESGRLAPLPAPSLSGIGQLFGDTWEWTASSYGPYPGYRPEGGALGEYNGKFMVSQQVLRGGSCFSPQSHLRPSYRNFFPPSARWQMSGVRAARSLP